MCTEILAHPFTHYVGCYRQSEFIALGFFYGRTTLLADQV